MTFLIRNLTVKNFMSVGNNTQAINFDRKDLTLVLGENLDLGGDDSGARNGTGKTTIANALSYAFFGQALTNIKKDNLINKTNGKGMLVTIEFIKDGVTYRIERGRKPAVLELYKGDVAFEAKDNDAQGDSRETQNEIDKILCMSPDMFRHIVALNTYTEPFLSLRANDQRIIIEQLLGITVLSEKSEALKEQIRLSKETVTSEEHRIKAITEANKKIEEQVVAIKRRQALWDTKHEEELTELSGSLGEMLTIDVDHEIEQHRLLAEWTLKDSELSSLGELLSRTETDMAREDKAITKLLAEIENIKDHKCHTCGQELHDEKQSEILAAKDATLAEHVNKLADLMEKKDVTVGKIEQCGELYAKPNTHYKKALDAHNHKNTVNNLTAQLEAKLAEENPYTDQISEMETSALIPVDYSLIDKTNKTKEHQEFLLKLLTNKDSFIRKRIIDQNLTYLNARLSHYLDKIGLPHTVVFQSDLSVNIEELGRELDFDNLSRGERGRLILSLNFAFRDVWESLYEKINILIVDELLDNGLDASGVEASFGILKKMSRDYEKSIWLISHRDDLTARATSILKVIKDGGFTTYSGVGNEL
jgi:DNA repair exonuclease SbcCD ATPase subunit